MALRIPAFPAPKVANPLGLIGKWRRRSSIPFYPDAELTFLVVPAEEASYQLRIGEIDLAMGTLTYDVLKTQGLSVSDGYFTDSVHAYVAPDSPASVGSLADGRLLIMTSELCCAKMCAMP